MTDNELFGNSEQLNDLISRRAALDALDRLEYTPGEWATNGLTMCKDAIKALPTVDAVPVKHGRWMLGVSLWYCSECGSSYSYNDYAYCPHCGAKMCGKEDGDGNG